MIPTLQPSAKQDLAFRMLENTFTSFLLFGGGAGGGKAQPLSSLVLTREGFVTMGSLGIGDSVVTSDNKDAYVTGIYPQGKQDIFEITLIDGAKIRTTQDHLFDCWVARRGQSSRKVRSVKEIMALKGNVLLPLSQPLDFGVPYDRLDSYTLGALLGDGGLSRSGVTFATEDTEIFDNFNLPNTTILHKGGCNYSLVQTKREETNRVIDELRRLGVYPISCDKRFIPSEIKNGSLHNRLWVLQGLMDTDGYIDKRGHCSFSSKSKKLALDVQYIVRSLGGKATLRAMRKFCTYNGVKKEGTYYEVYIQTKNNDELFRLKRKKERVKPYNGGVSELGRRIIGIKKVGYEDAQCISITGNHLYISNDFIVTHNTWFGCEWLLTNCYKYPGTKWFIGRKELKRLMASTYVTWVKVCKFHGIPETDWSLNSQYNYIQFTNGSRIDLLDVAHKPTDPLFERFGSLEFTGGWGEEVGEWEFMAFDVLKTRIGRHMNKEYNLLPPKFLLTCNPTQNWLYRIFYKPFRSGTLPKDYAFIQSLYKDNPFSRDIYGEQLEKITDRVLKARLKEGLWEYSADDLALVSYDAIVDMFVNTVNDEPTKYFSADVARFGSDKIVYGAWRGSDLYKLEERTKQPQTTTEEDIRDMLAKEFIPYQNAIIDEDGMGGGIVDHLTGVNGFMGNRSPIVKPDDSIDNPYANLPPTYLTKPNYRNLRSQCYFMLADRINTHKLSVSAPLTEIQREMLIEELQQIKRMDDNPDAPLQIASKDQIKEAIGRSPDYADTLMMKMYFEVIKLEPKPRYNPPDERTIMEAGGLSPFGGVGFDL